MVGHRPPPGALMDNDGFERAELAALWQRTASDIATPSWLAPRLAGGGHDPAAREHKLRPPEDLPGTQGVRLLPSHPVL